MTRKQIRYLLFRIRTAAEGGSECPEPPENFKKSFESQAKFLGWPSFGVTWDVGGRIPNEDNPLIDATSKESDQWTIVLREESLDDAWNTVLARVVTPLPEAATQEINHND